MDFILQSLKSFAPDIESMVLEDLQEQQSSISGPQLKTEVLFLVYPKDS